MQTIKRKTKIVFELNVSLFIVGGVQQRAATNVSSSSRLVRAVPPASNNLMQTPLKAENSTEDSKTEKTECKELIIPVGEHDKMDVDVEMKSVNTTPTKNQPQALSSPSVDINIMQTDIRVEDDNKNKTTLESMETSEQTSSSVARDVLTPKTQKSCNERLELMLSKILNATWNEFCTGSMICPQTASFIEQHPEKRYDFESLVTNVLMECVLRLYNDEDVGASSGSDNNVNTNDTDMKSDGASGGAAAYDSKTSNKTDCIPTYSTPKKIKSDDTEVQEIMANVINDQPSTSRGLQSGKHSNEIYCKQFLNLSS